MDAGAAAGRLTAGGVERRGAGTPVHRAWRGWCLMSVCLLSVTCLRVVEEGELKKPKEVGEKMNGSPHLSVRILPGMLRFDGSHGV